MLAWPHSGFHAHDAVWSAADDKEFTVRLARYCARNPIALGRMEYDERQSAVTYHSDKPTGPTAGSETTDAVEFLARLTSHIPNKGQVLQRYYGFYSSRQRGRRRKAAEADADYEEHPLVTVDPEPEAVRQARHRWAELLRRIFEVDPLACPRCGEQMRVVAFITEPKVIDRILDHLRRTTPTRRHPRAPPRRWKSSATTASAQSHAVIPARSTLGESLGCPGAPLSVPISLFTRVLPANSVLFARSTRQGDVAMPRQAVAQLQFRAAYLGWVDSNSYRANRGAGLDPNPLSVLDV